MSPAVPSQVVPVDAGLLESYVQHLGAIGEQSGGGLIRPVYGEAWVRARAQVQAWMEEAGLEVHGDAVGNLFGRLRGTEDDRRTILTGSHLDTVKLGGKYDGALGVLSSLSAVRALRERLGAPRISLEVVALCEEEGSRFHAGFWGTRGMLGLIEPGDVDDLRDDDGVTIGEAMRQVGLDPAAIPAARRTDLAAFLELHIEQGRIMVDEGVPIGIVEAITGLVQQVITVHGRVDHAGATPMDLRLDAGQGAAEMMLLMARVAEAEGRPAVATIGSSELSPGAFNIVPGAARLSLDLRHPNPETLARLGHEIRSGCEAVARRRTLTVDFEAVHEARPRDMDERLRAVLTAAADLCGLNHRPMVSGAGHDSQLMGTRVPTAMLFVPSQDGRSHSAAEYTTPEDAARGASVLGTALAALAYGDEISALR